MSKTEARRALIASALGFAVGVLAALFSRKEKHPEGRRTWRGRSAT